MYVHEHRIFNHSPAAPHQTCGARPPWLLGPRRGYSVRAVATRSAPWLLGPRRGAPSGCGAVPCSGGESHICR